MTIQLSILTNMKMTSCVYFLIILAVVSSAASEEVDPDTTPDTISSELSSIFDVKGNEEIPLEVKKNVVCDTKECQIIANEFIRGMNKSVAPCDNFYDFVCGAWETGNVIPDYEPMWSRFHIFQNTVNRRIKGILETEPLTTDILPVRQAKKWYRSCLDIEALEERGILPIEAILLQVGGWPMSLDPEEWDEDEHSWQSVEHDYFHITGSHVFYDISVSYGDEFAIMLERGSIPLHRQLPQKYRNYTGNDYEIYVSIIAEVTELFAKHNKASITIETIEKDAQDLVEFEKELYMLAYSIEEYDYNNWTLIEFVEWYNQNVTEVESDDKIQKIDFANLIRRKFDLVNRFIEDSGIVFVDSNNYYVQMTKLLNRTPTRTIVNYIHWHFISEMLVYTTELMRDTFFKIMKNEFDVQKRPPRWLECIEEMKMTTAAAYAFVQEYYSQEVEDAAKEMIANVREEMGKQIGLSNWMDDETKTLAKKKLDEMDIFIGFPDWYKNKTSVLNSYKGLAIGYDHFDNILSFKKYEIKKSLRITNMFDMDDMISWPIDPTTVNALYNMYDNIVVLPAADFQPPLFTSRVPPSVNYGILGLAVGHEIGHGFDKDAFRYGPLDNETEISEEMQELYDESAECFVEQFNKYFGVTEDPDSDDWGRGRLTRPDNVADSTGLHSVFKAFKKLIETHSVENYKLPGFEHYTDDQMFYIAFAGMWCESVTPKFEEIRTKYGGHSPGRWRVIGSISNTNDFAEAFNCPNGSPMNPEKKCNIWQSPSNNVISENPKEIKRRRRLGWVRKS